MDYLGELAAVGTALLWASNSIFLTLAGKRVGSQAVNAARLILALGVMVLLHLALYGTAFPRHIGWPSLMALGSSGLVGLAVADAFLFESMLILGPRVALVLTMLSPIFSTFLAWAILGQSLSLMKLGAILGTSVGVACVLRERAQGTPKDPLRARAWTFGVTLGIGAALGQAVGFNPRYHKLISSFHSLTGVPLLLNTSFNDDEPIVCSPADAIETFKKTHGIWFNGIANRDGKGRNVEELESKIRSLRSFFSVKLLVEEGEPVTRTVDLATCPSVVFLMHADPEIIQEDYNALRVFEQEHFV